MGYRVFKKSDLWVSMDAISKGPTQKIRRSKIKGVLKLRITLQKLQAIIEYLLVVFCIRPNSSNHVRRSNFDSSDVLSGKHPILWGSISGSGFCSFYTLSIIFQQNPGSCFNHTLSSILNPENNACLLQ